MRIIKKLTTVPDNFDEFLAEISPEYTRLYGKAAAHQYAATIKTSLSHSLQHPDVCAYGMVIDGTVAGMMMAQLRLGVGHIVFVHVLYPYREQALETELLDACVSALKQRSVTRVISETIPLYPVALNAAFDAQGFHCIERALMRHALSTDDELKTEDLTTPMDTKDEQEVASLLLAAYQDHPDRVLHQELQHPDAALSLLRRYRAGEYGTVQPQWMRVMKKSGLYEGMIMAHALSPEVGYVFQLAVQPARQRQGIGQCLMQSLLSEMTQSGIQQVLLGVTLMSPAFKLYQHMNFTTLLAVNTYVWDEYKK